MGGMNKLPRPKIHENLAARQKAYNERKRDERDALRALSLMLLSGEVSREDAINQLMHQLPEGQKKALERLVSSQHSVTNLKKVAA